MNSFPEFIISDTHWGHRNINLYCQRLTPTFPRQQDVERLMVDNWMGAVGEGETILHLGDMLGTHRPKNDRPWLRDLLGEKYVIRGNHDKWSKKFIEEHGFTVVEPFTLEYGEYWKVLFSHHPVRDLDDDQINVHGHIHNNATDGLTSRHINVSVEVRAFCPQRLMPLLSDCIARQMNKPRYQVSDSST